MKKLLAIIAAALLAPPFFADIYSPHRYVEFGAGLSLEEGQNIYGLSDIFVKNLVVDLPEIYSSMGNGGFYLNLGETANLHFNVNINGYGAGLKVSESLSASMNISKDFFKLLAKGNDLDTQVDTKMSANIESYIDASLPIYFRIKKMKITMTPSYFIPLLYLPNPSATLSYITNSNGKVSAKAHADFSLYSIIDLEKGIVYSDEEKGLLSSFDVSSLGSISNLVQDTLLSTDGCGGVDLALQVEFPLSQKLDCGIYTNVPIFHGVLKNCLSGSADFSASTEGFLNHFTGDDTSGDAFEMDYSISGLKSTSDWYYVNRPFRLGAELAFRPFGSWFTIHPKVGVAVRNPFGNDFDISSIYPEYSLSADFNLFKILGASICTEYTDKVFVHSLNLFLNARVVEINIFAGTSSADFLKSFNLSGLKAGVGFSFGF